MGPWSNGGGQPYVYYRSTLIQPKTWRGLGPPGPLGDYMPDNNKSYVGVPQNLRLLGVKY